MIYQQIIFNRKISPSTIFTTTRIQETFSSSPHFRKGPTTLNLISHYIRHSQSRQKKRTKKRPDKSAAAAIELLPSNRAIVANKQRLSSVSANKTLSGERFLALGRFPLLFEISTCSRRGAFRSGCSTIALYFPPSQMSSSAQLRSSAVFLLDIAPSPPSPPL